MMYDWKADSYGSWLDWLHFMRLHNGLRRFETVKEMYWLEQWGEVP
jgi:hypothetical protein